MTTGDRKTAGIIVIGNEVLSSKVVDRNTPNILASMARHGIAVGEVAVLADEVERIAAVVADFARRFDLVVTTGGVGPTHDDCTWKSVALAMDDELAVRPELLAWMEERIGGPLNSEQTRMVLLPTRAQLARDDHTLLIHLDNVWVLPGVPSMVETRIERICSRYAAPRPWLATVYFDAEEWRCVHHIDALVEAFGDLDIGSYPIFDQDDHRLQITFEGSDRERVSQAVDQQVAAIGEKHLVRVQWSGGQEE